MKGKMPTTRKRCWRVACNNAVADAAYFSRYRVFKKEGDFFRSLF
jgi:hypothetical protein